MYPPLPTLDPRGTDEGTASYGARVLTFLIRTGVTATLTDADLELAEYACNRALSTRVLVGPPEARESTPTAVYDTIEDVRRTVCAMLKGRATDREAVPVPVAEPQAVPPRDGPKVLRPVEPLVRPPSGAYATADVAF